MAARVKWTQEEKDKLVQAVVTLWREKPEGLLLGLLGQAQMTVLTADRRRPLPTWTAAKDVHADIVRAIRAQVSGAPTSVTAPEQGAPLPVNTDALARAIVEHVVHHIIHAAKAAYTAITPTAPVALAPWLTPSPRPPAPTEPEPPAKSAPAPAPVAAPAALLVLAQTDRELQRLTANGALDKIMARLKRVGGPKYGLKLQAYAGAHPDSIKWDGVKHILAPVNLPSHWSQVIAERSRSEDVWLSRYNVSADEGAPASFHAVLQRVLTPELKE